MSRPAVRAGNRRGETGVALLGALLLVAIVVSLAFTIGERSRYQIATTARLFESHVADELFSRLENEARGLLRADLLAGQSDAFDDDWHSAVLTTAREGGAGEATLADLDGLFNLNNLVPDAGGAAPAAEPVPGADTPETQAIDDGARPAAGGGGETGAVTMRAPAGVSLTTPPPVGTAAGAQSSRPPAAPTPMAPAATSSVDAIDFLPPGVYRDPREDARQMVGSAPSAASATPGSDPLLRDDESPPAGNESVAGAPGVNAATTTAAYAALIPDPGAGVVATVGGRRQSLTKHEMAIARFNLLLTALDLDPAVIPAILDWLDTDSDARFPGGAEDDYYMAQDVPYRAANRPFADVTELRLVRGVTPEIYARLAPLICVLPRRTAINVNTAPPEVLMSLGPGLDRATVDILIAARESQPFQSVASFTGFPLLAGRPLLADGLATQSNWFSVTMHAEAGASTFAARALVTRNAPEEVAVVERSRGYFDD